MKKEKNKVFFFFVKKKIKKNLSSCEMCNAHENRTCRRDFSQVLSVPISFYIEVHLGLRTLSVDQNCVYYTPWDCWTHPCMSYYLWSGRALKTVHFFWASQITKDPLPIVPTFIQPKQQKSGPINSNSPLLCASKRTKKWTTFNSPHYEYNRSRDPIIQRIIWHWVEKTSCYALCALWWHFIGICLPSQGPTKARVLCWDSL
jgi:hypothetical protein